MSEEAEPCFTPRGDTAVADFAVDDLDAAGDNWGFFVSSAWRTTPVASETEEALDVGVEDLDWSAVMASVDALDDDASTRAVASSSVGWD